MSDDSTRHPQRIGRERSPSSAANLSTSTKFAKADSVNRRARMNPTRKRGTAAVLRESVAIMTPV